MVTLHWIEFAAWLAAFGFAGMGLGRMSLKEEFADLPRRDRCTGCFVKRRA